MATLSPVRERRHPRMIATRARWMHRALPVLGWLGGVGVIGSVHIG